MSLLFWAECYGVIVEVDFEHELPRLLETFILMKYIENVANQLINFLLLPVLGLLQCQFKGRISLFL